MAKLTQKQIKQIEIALSYIRRTREYISRPDIAVCRRDRFASTTLHYTNQFGDGSCLYEIDKHIGSDLQLLDHAAMALQLMLTPVAVEAEE